MLKNSIATGIPLLQNESTASSYEHVLAHNALLHVRSEDWNSAYQDAEMSVKVRPSTMGYIARSLAQIGLGKSERAIQIFDLTFWNCDPEENNLLLLLKTIIFFVAGKYDEAISRLSDLIAVPGDAEITYCCNQVLAKMYLMRNDFESAVDLLERAQAYASANCGCHLESISLTFGWSFEGLDITAWQRNCEALHTAGHTEMAAEALRKILKNFDKEIRANQEKEAWVTEFKNKCIDKLEVRGDEALSSENYAEAIARYSSALSLIPSNPINILLKRSKAGASKKAWKDALMDADEVIKLDPLSHRGYERKYIALHGIGDYDGALEALRCMSSIIQRSSDEELRKNYIQVTSPEPIYAAIEVAVCEVFTLCPLVLIDLTTGRLCNAQERIQMFKSDTLYKKLVFEAAITKTDRVHIRQSVANYFKWVMFSHTWDGEEPTFQEVNLVEKVWNLDESPLKEKLCQFCTTAHADGFRWAWSDTCCIDKTTSTILNRSLTSMYSWYERAAATLVYLADVLSSSELGALTKSRWMTRAWTLQELLASKVVRFYDREWKPYLNDTRSNHKESPFILKELADAMKVPQETIAAFRPSDVGVREKLRLASTRKATEVEDVAYSLIGIFSSNIMPRYGIGDKAIALLLEGIVDRSGDVTVLAWTGSSSQYNSALPASLAVYSRMPCRPPCVTADEIDTQVKQLQHQVSFEDAKRTYDQVTALDRATFSNGCLRLPCITFLITKLRALEIGNNGQRHLYLATAAILGTVKFRTAAAMPLQMERKLVFVHPWRHELIDPYDGLASDVEHEVGVESSTDIKEPEPEPDSDTSVPPSPLETMHFPPPLNRSTRALRLIARLAQPFNAILLEQQQDGRYRRVAADEEIVCPGIPHPITPRRLKGIHAKVLEVI